MIRSAFTHFLEREALSYALSVCQVVPAGLKEQVGDYASLSVALHALESLALGLNKGVEIE